MAYQTVIFDMDGTILNTLEDLCDGVNATLEHFGYPTRTLEEVRRFVGNGATKLIRRSLPEGADEATVQTVLDFYRPYYEAHSQIKTAPYPRIPGLLQELRERGVQTAVVSNKPDGAVRLLAEHYFPGCFTVAIGDRPGFDPKPAPDSVKEAMRLLNANPETAVYVGDSEVDIATAKNAGLDCVSVTWGFRGEDFLRTQGGTRFAHTCGELLAAILEPAK